MNKNKKELQEENEALKIELEEFKQQMETLQSENNGLLSDKAVLKQQLSQESEKNDRLNGKVSGLLKESMNSKNQLAEYKREIDNLSDTKTVLDGLMDILRSPHNDYQRVVDELNDRFCQEKSRADALDQELRNIQYDIQQIKFLDGKVQAYEAMFRVNPVRAAWGDIEPGEMLE